MKTRTSIDIEHKGKEIRFYGELLINGFVAFADSYEWRNINGADDTEELRLEMMEAAIEYCCQNDGWGKLSFEADGRVIKATALWKRLGLCPNCGGKYIGIKKKKCNSGICDGEHFYRGNKLYANIWRALAVVGLIFVFVVPFFLIGISAAIAFVVGYLICVLFWWRLFRYLEYKDSKEVS